MYKKFTKGFTLIELLVVIAIIGILASIVLVSLNSARSKGKDTRVVSDVNQVRTQVETDNTGATFPDFTGTASVSGANTTAGTAAGAGATNMGTLNTDATTNGPGGTGNGLSYLIQTNSSGVAVAYSIYGKTSTGYYCVDSTGNNITNTASGAVPVAGTAVAVTCH